MPTPRIRAEYDGLDQIAKKFLDRAEQISKSLERLSSQSEVLYDGDWIGEGAKKFNSEMNSSVLPSMRGLSEVLEESGRITQKISTIMHQADEDIARLISIPGPVGETQGVAKATQASASTASAATQARDKSVDRVLSKVDPKVRALVKKSPSLSSQIQSLEGKVKFKMGPKGSKATYYNPKTKEIVISPTESTNAQVSAIAHEVGHAKYGKIPYHKPTAGMTKAEYIRKNVQEQMRDEGSAQLNAAIVRDEVKKAGGPTLGMPGKQDANYIKAYNDYKKGTISRQKAIDQMANLMGNETTSLGNKPYKEYYGSWYEKRWNKEVGRGKTRK